MGVAGGSEGVWAYSVGVRACGHVVQCRSEGVWACGWGRWEWQVGVRACGHVGVAGGSEGVWACGCGRWE